MEIMRCIAISAMVSALVTMILSTQIFKIADDYVKGICDGTKKFIEDMIHEIKRR